MLHRMYVRAGEGSLCSENKECGYCKPGGAAEAERAKEGIAPEEEPEEEPAPHSTPTAQLGVARRTAMRLNEQEWRGDRAHRAAKEERDACAQERLLQWVHAQHASDRCRCAEKRNDPESPN